MSDPTDWIIDFHLPEGVRVQHDVTTGALRITGITASVASAMAAELEGLARAMQR